MSSWYKNINAGDIAVSSRVRIARNLTGIPFPKRMNDTQKTALLDKMKSVTNNVSLKKSGSLKYINMETVPQEEQLAMVERHIISPEFAANNGPKGLVINDDESVSVMLLEEDHIRIQVILGGLDLEKAYDIAAEIESLFAKNFSLAFDSQLGYLTECPTNLGTGLRASVMLHLPILEKMGNLAELADSVSKIGLTVRGMYGEGSKASASFYQLSNQITLGISEKGAIENLNAITTQIINKEKSARNNLERVSVEDVVFRALGVLKYARKISSDEMMKLLSSVKLGVSMGIINDIPAELPLTLLIETQPASLQKANGRMTPDDRDICRANIIRKSFK